LVRAAPINALLFLLSKPELIHMVPGRAAKT